MSEVSVPPKPERNPVTHRIHRRQVFWQITLPVLLGVLLLIALGVLASLGVPGKISQRADVALIWLVAPQLLVCLFFLAILMGLAIGLTRLIQVLPFSMRKLQDFFVTAGKQIQKLSDRMAEPVLRVHGLSASIQAFLRILRRPPDNRSDDEPGK